MINWRNAQIKIRTSVIIDQINLRIQKGESIGIIGENGTGKTILAKALSGSIPVFVDINSDFHELKTVFVSFQSSIKINNGFTAYRQQRWNNIDPDSVPKVSDELNYSIDHLPLNQLIDKFDFRKHLNSFVINLSNGEQRKLELIRALAQQPDLLILDNAFNSLDADSRMLLAQLINHLVTEKQSIVMTGLKNEDFPESIQNFVKLSHIENPVLIHRSEIVEEHIPELFNFDELPFWRNSNFDELIDLENVSLKYGDKYILKNITWQVKAGERWVLSGSNGSGKTSLLNLIFADNPKAYGCNIRLFGKPKGSGETIWDIKKQIGFISPELQQYLPRNQNALQVICSGFFDSEGTFTKPTTYQQGLARNWLKMIGHISWADKPFGTLSASAQRIVLILRTLVKNPPLLLLDEPFQGLDSLNISKIQKLLNTIAIQTNCAMVFVTHFSYEIPESFTHELNLKAGVIHNN